MKLLEVDIENFGIFTGQRLQFGTGGFHLIHGPNEAGKSTLLQLIRELLFGFPHSSPFAFDSHKGEMAATVRAQLDDGRQLQFRRRKGRNDTVRGEFLDNGQEIDATALDRLLGSANSQLYQHVFGFSLEELTSGEQSLNQANLSEALYGGGIGGLGHFQKVQSQIAQQRETLYNPRARKPRINELLTRIRAATKELRDAAVSPREYTQLQQQHDELTQRLTELRGELESHRSRQRHLQRLYRALAPWRQLRLLHEELEQTPVPQSLAANASEQFEQVLCSLAEVDEQIKQIELEVTDNAAALQSLRLMPEVLAQQPVIYMLNQQIGQIKGFLEDLPKRREERSRLLEEISKQLAALDPTWTLEHLDKYEAGVAQMTQVKEMAEQAATLDSKRQTLTSRRPDVEDRLQQLRGQLEELPEAEELPLLEELSDQVAAYQQSRKEHAELERKLELVRNEMDRLRRRLCAGIEFETDSFETLVVPREAAAVAAHQQFQQAAAEVLRIRQLARDVEQSIEQYRQELVKLETQQRVPDRETLLRHRQSRDQLWRQIRGHYIDKSISADAEPPSPGRFEEEMLAADQLSDQRQAHAEVVAKQDQLRALLEQAQSRLATILREQDQAEEQRVRLTAEWQAQWEPAGIVPGDPQQMRDWLHDHQKLIDAGQALEATQRQLDDTAQQLRQFESTLAAAVGDGSRGVTENIARLKQLVRSARENETLRKRSLAEIPDLERQLAKLDAELERIETAKSDWQARWERMLDGFGFPRDWSASLAQDILSGLAHARSRRREVQSLDQRISDMQSGAALFEQQVAEVCRAVAPQLAELPAVAAAEELSRLLDQAKNAAQKREDLLAQQQTLQRRLARSTAMQQQKQQAKLGLLATAQVADETAFREVARRAARRAELHDEINGLQRELRAIREAEDADAFDACLAQVETDQLELELAQVADRIEALEAELQELARTDGETREKLRRIDTQTECVRKAAELESLRASLRDALDQWAPLVIAQTLMNRAIQKFEREHQPAMMRTVASLLERMTNGRYVDIHRRLDATGTLLVEQADGTRKEPQMLSTGTREQLYLAIRLAYIRHYCQEAESLPVVMDDVLVNFDDQRAESTFDAIMEFADQVQVLFLTCHQHTVELVQQRRGVEVTYLQSTGSALAVGNHG